MRDGAGVMAYLDAETYRAREAQWREQAADLAGREQNVCLALAEGYADLIKLLGRPVFSEAPHAASTPSLRRQGGSSTERATAKQPATRSGLALPKRLRIGGNRRREAVL